MTDGTPICSRCGNSLSDDAFTLSLQKDLSESVPRDLQLCPRCVESFQRWVRKRGNLFSKAASNLQPESSSELLSASSSKHSKRRHHRKREMQPWVRNVVVTSLTILLFILTFMWTWRVLSHATRVEEP